MYEELCKRLRGFWAGEGGPANEAADVIEQLEKRVQELEYQALFYNPPTSPFYTTHD